MYYDCSCLKSKPETQLAARGAGRSTFGRLANNRSLERLINEATLEELEEYCEHHAPEAWGRFREKVKQAVVVASPSTAYFAVLSEDWCAATLRHDGFMLAVATARSELADELRPGE